MIKETSILGFYDRLDQIRRNLCKPHPFQAGGIDLAGGPLFLLTLPHHRRRVWIRGPQPSDIRGGEPEPRAAADEEDHRGQDEKDEKGAGGPIVNPTPSARGIRHHLVVRADAFYPRCPHEQLRLIDAGFTSHHDAFVARAAAGNGSDSRLGPDRRARPHARPSA